MRAFVFSVLALAGCAQPAGGPNDPAPQSSSELAQQIRADNERLDGELRAAGIVAAGIGETADLGGGLTVRPLRVAEDSRCPQNATCVWAGRLRLRAMVSGIERELTLGEPLSTVNGTVVLAVAKPGPWTDWPTSEVGRPPYRFGFRRQ